MAEAEEEARELSLEEMVYLILDQVRENGRVLSYQSPEITNSSDISRNLRLYYELEERLDALEEKIESSGAPAPKKKKKGVME